MELGKINELTYLSLVTNKKTNQAKTKTLKERNHVVILDIYIMVVHGTVGHFFLLYLKGNSADFY